MIPYYEIPPISVFGLFQIHAFGTIVGLGILMAYFWLHFRGKQEGFTSKQMDTLFWWCTLSGFIGAHWAEIFFYQPQKLSSEGVLTLLKLWDGISSYGGFLGALGGLLIYFQILKKQKWLIQADIAVQGIVVAWIFGRLGCTIVHDHPGILTDFFLAVQYPGGARHNLGMYEFLFTLFFLFPGMIAVHRWKPKFPAASTIFITLTYGVFRFFLDFLRAKDLPGSDLRYFGLTFAQYASVFIVIAGILIWVRVKKSKLTSSQWR